MNKCPTTNQPCPLLPPCAASELVSKVDCIEWVKTQRRIGFKLAGESIPDDLKEGKQG